MSVANLMHQPSAPGGASPRCASRMRRLLGGLSLLALLAVSPARAATAPPVPSTPTDALALLKWCWESRDVALYHELFADNYQYFYDAGNPAGAPYRITPWTREDELASGTNLFVGGGSLHAPASSVTFSFTDGPTLQPSAGGLASPWHQQYAAQWALDITCTDGSTLHGEGQSKWFLVRGDSAAIPQELKDRGFTADPNRWYIERWLEQQSNAPIVRAPSQASGTPFSPITVHVAAQDPDGDPISSLIATVSGFVPRFEPAADNTAGMFTWIPYPTDVGPHGVTFTAANSLVGSASTILNVVASNQPPIPALVVTPPGGVGPLSVTADASGSFDPDGRIVSYQFNFGDGTAVGPQSGPTATHTYVAIGTWPLTMTVTDDIGASALIAASVTVMAAPVASVLVTPASASVTVGGTQQLVATARDASGNALSGRTITWTSDNTAAATVSSSGLVRGVAAGLANITATCEGKSGSSAITIFVPPVASVSVTPASATLAPGATQQLTATPKDAIGNALTGRIITWGSDNTAAATVSSSGVVSGVAAGLANITATCEGKSGSSAITIFVPPVASVSVTPASATLAPGATQQLTATPKDAIGNALTGRIITWASDNTAAATVSSSGVVSGVAAGAANITATCEGKSGSSTISIVPVASVSVTPASASVSVGATQQLTATVKDASGNALTGRTIAWASDNSAAATVNSIGLVTGVAVGSANITATCEGNSGSSAIAVIVIPVASVSVTPAIANLAPGATRQLSASPKDASGNALAGRTITWGSDNTAAATVNSSGLVTGVAVGAANITAACEGSSGASAITVSEAPSTAAAALALLKWCWEHRDVVRYHELFTDNFQYYYDAENPAGAPYRITPWSRSDELVSSSNLFLGEARHMRPPRASRLLSRMARRFNPVPGGSRLPGTSSSRLNGRSTSPAWTERAFMAMDRASGSWCGETRRQFPRNSRTVASLRIPAAGTSSAGSRSKVTPRS